MNSDKKIFLFDMDGTLTPPRERIQGDMVRSLRDLSAIGRIGILTGSDFDYVWDQMEPAFGMGGIPVNRVDILPCNGTKKYVSSLSRKFELVHDVNMQQEIGPESYNTILRHCMGWQWQIMTKFQEIPYTGTFFQYRGSLLNWCPVGRSASSEERRAWVDEDTREHIREYYSELLTDMMSLSGIRATAALGGSTSVDIYPTGWDKTYGLQHYTDEEVYFTGDKCDPGGNDWHIYEELKDTGRAFKVETPEDTLKIINKLISSS